ncbi:50S ribosomal protein L33 [Protomyces lactucae-debilis]|jgi:large subunit ribosomal protein L33|uniref:Large ribosomal subunit protein bL33m n=1 Tax=Protomyces lactucae-debilis TaxID=2754530 RepID=A0A1Y2F6D3_PROLT|nr:50S ribosomal protein L33 [Protomyces lactucae-debilis]ORY79433.1 50S ribosomal protein L33 [Protomyces lactucae-debilis]
MAKKARARNILVKLLSTAGTGTSYVRQRPRLAAYKLNMVKFDPKVNARVMFEEVRLKK